MTEADWLTCESPEKLFAFIEAKVTERQLRLFICACVRQVWKALESTSSERAVEYAERYPDGGVSAKMLEDMAWPALCAMDHVDLGPATGNARTAAMYAPMVHPKVDHATEAGWYVAQVTPGGYSEKEQATLVRELVPNPFRPVTVDLAWRTSTVLLLAQGIYEERAFDRMPILADALQDAGCDNDDILNHLRDTNAVGGQGAEAPRTPHVRGCWALDLILGKS